MARFRLAGEGRSAFEAVGATVEDGHTRWLRGAFRFADAWQSVLKAVGATVEDGAQRGGCVARFRFVGGERSILRVHVPSRLRVAFESIMVGDGQVVCSDAIHRATMARHRLRDEGSTSRSASGSV